MIHKSILGKHWSLTVTSAMFINCVSLCDRLGYFSRYEMKHKNLLKTKVEKKYVCCFSEKCRNRRRLFDKNEIMRFLNYFLSASFQRKEKPLSQIWVFVIGVPVTHTQTHTHMHTYTHTHIHTRTHTQNYCHWMMVLATGSISLCLHFFLVSYLLLSTFHNFVYCNYMAVQIEWDAEHEEYFWFNDSLTKVISLFVRCNTYSWPGH